MEGHDLVPQQVTVSVLHASPLISLAAHFAPPRQNGTVTADTSSAASVPRATSG